MATCPRSLRDSHQIVNPFMEYNHISCLPSVGFIDKYNYHRQTSPILKNSLDLAVNAEYPPRLELLVKM
jgi:hypothetical protein